VLPVEPPLKNIPIAFFPLTLILLLIVLAVEEAAVVAGLHEFDEAEGYGAGFDVGEGVGQGLPGVLAQQQGVDFDAVKAGIEDGFEVAQDVAAFVFAGDFLEGVGVEAVDADVEFVEAGGEADEEGIVTFEASWRDGTTGRTGAQRERSRFERRRGLWVYVSGTDR